MAFPSIPHVLLRTEATSNNVRDFGVPKAIEAVPQLRETMAVVTDRYLTVQQDVLKTFVDRGQLRQLAEPTRLATDRRVPGLKLDHPRPAEVVAPGGSFSESPGRCAARPSISSHPFIPLHGGKFEHLELI
jgi:hypothetical protein